jgi:F420-dependent methylenetetrahydromethanopterin dehydrogenase
MPIKCKAFDNERIMVFTVIGHMEPGDVEAAFKMSVSASNYDPDWNVMVDLSAADMSRMSARSIRADAQHISGVTMDTPHKLGIVIDRNHVNLGPAMLVDAYLKSLGAAQLARTFVDHEGCMTWLRAPWTEAERRHIADADPPSS